eukprot:Hpha_TRINITY_DN16605_c0_g2::TRINITY_DN16605_c0_g2_i1::g.182627::m.182627/K13303/SGK2; serum/glucocorticoid-regulated kinase 2
MIAHGGFLRKLSGGVKAESSSSIRSRELYFELQGQYLYYYNRRPIYETEPLGEIDLHNSVLSEDLLLENAFVVNAPAMRASYRLEAHSLKEKEDWMFELRARSSAPTSFYRRVSTRLSSVSSGSSTSLGPQMTMADFDTIRTLGKGAFGKVRLVRRRSSGEVYALKSMSKREILHQGMLGNTKEEREVLSQLRHPFIVHLHFAFHDATQLHLVMDYLSGGELFEHMSDEGCFPESRARFYAAQVGLALSHIHSLGIIYRDLKPENLVLDSKGNCCLTDFGLATKAKLAESFVGTAAYIAPEFLIGEPHDLRADYWSLGILIFEMVIGIPPFYDDDVSRMYEKVLGAPLNFEPDGEVVTVSEELKCLCSGLLSRDKEKRLSGLQVLDHPWFAGIDRAALLRGELEPPYVPDPASSDDSAEEDCLSRCQSLRSLQSDKATPLQRGLGSFSGFSYAGSWIADEVQSQASEYFDLVDFVPLSALPTPPCTGCWEECGLA